MAYLLLGLSLDKWLTGLPDLRAPFVCAEKLRAAGYAIIEDIVTAGSAKELGQHTGLSMAKAEIIHASARGEHYTVYLWSSFSRTNTPHGIFCMATATPTLLAEADIGRCTGSGSCLLP